MITTTLQCSKCKCEKNSSEFNRVYSKNRKRQFQYYCKECTLKSQKLHYKLHPEKKRKSDRRYFLRNREAFRIRSKAYGYKLKLASLCRYSINFNHPACVCCNESKVAFLTIDHIKGGGTKHRKELTKSKMSGNSFYRWLKNQQYPLGYQTLCFNCNSGRQVNGGVCPHEQEFKNITHV